ncbi:plasmid pRiA4b ORF-3 family protein [Sutcliffiella deserti]|uniref:plasmid pRiA4b ORF-3 family protein n=1 Tax=Sutcliffiella deserti TaxID=2875501 RepID=UPI0021DF93DA|nr:plasmid pRiA4b ORF-3 family protein [Sutcliffiella deserti]
MKATLMLENYSVWRNIIVPSDTTFPKLHKILQEVFTWQNSHLHDFTIFPSSTNGKVVSITQNIPIVTLVCHEEAFNYQGNVPMQMETGRKLSEYLLSKFVYNYDFGDDWQHKIEVESLIEDYIPNYPTCLSGEGNAPPEVVGGEPGYEHFLETILDKENPDREHMLSWGRSQGYEEFDLEKTNRSLRKL